NRSRSDTPGADRSGFHYTPQGQRAYTSMHAHPYPDECAEGNQCVSRAGQGGPENQPEGRERTDQGFSSFAASGKDWGTAANPAGGFPPSRPHGVSAFPVSTPAAATIVPKPRPTVSSQRFILNEPSGAGRQLSRAETVELGKQAVTVL